MKLWDECRCEELAAWLEDLDEDMLRKHPGIHLHLTIQPAARVIRSLLKEIKRLEETSCDRDNEQETEEPQCGAGQGSVYAGESPQGGCGS